MTQTTTHSPLASSADLAGRAAEFRLALGQWYQANHRQLPWRTTPSLYRTVVSEMMLQQTRIDTALPFFDRWLATLPDFQSLAAASEGQVLKLWEGLGYYRRARNLHRLARELVALPTVPTSPEAWRNFTGIGPYSAAAITSIAFGAPAACVDGNVVRVLARLIGHDRPLKDSSSAARLFQPLAQTMLDPGDPGSHNQAMMELGATVCQKVPACGACPVADFCQGRRSGQAADIPTFPAKQIEKISVVRVWIERGDSLLLARPGKNSRRLAELHELPSCDQIGLAPQDVMERGALRLTRKRSITRYSITESIYQMGEDIDFEPMEEGLAWLPIHTLDQITFSGPHRRWVDTLLADRKYNIAPEQA
jgi:A/G-specific adenine glycosylase